MEAPRPADPAPNGQGSAPLNGIRVVSLEQAVAAPLCTEHLADLGAEIIKIERTGGGDFARAYDTTVGGESAWFYWLNRNKRSVALDLKHPDARAVVARLLTTADVFVQNLGPGAAERLGLGASALRRTYPRLVVCNISGYGSTGPYRERKAYDALLQGETGVIALTGSEAESARAGISVADIATGMYGLVSILAALFGRDRSQEGRTIEISLFDSLTQWVSPALYGFLATGRQPARAGSRHANIVPYGLFPTDAGRQVNLAVQNEREWDRFCRIVLGEPDLATDPRYTGNENRARNRADLEPHIEHYFATLGHEEVVRRLEEADVAWGEYRDVAGLAGHPQLLARGRLLAAEREGLPPVVAHPMNLEGLTHRAGVVPSVGQDTRAVMAEVGFSRGEIDALLASGAAEASD
jgi:itaconate CoA-transferase